jgi:Flp pilus assembly pilin Flp
MRPDQLIKRSLKRLLGERSGASAAEFAILAPVLFLAVIGIIELAVLLTVQVLLEGSVREASRFGITGYVPPGVTRDQQIRTLIQRYTLGMIDMSRVVIDVRVYPSFAAIQRPEPCYKYIMPITTPPQCDTSSAQNWVDSNGDGVWFPGNGTPGSGNAGDIVLYNVHYNHYFMTSFMRRLFARNGSVMLGGSLVVRNEPW